MLMKIRKAIKRKDNEKGFTLIELIVVMAILAVLAGIAVPKYTDVMDRSRTNADKASLKILNDAVDMYYADKNAYPEASGATVQAVETKLKNEGYLKSDDYQAADGTFTWNGAEFSK